tara:strand:+ start:424 stop:1353 length:930 start_codon:yes stop_codon:yes gene_type:complete
MITCNSYFSGGGVFDAGLIAGGLTIKQSYELDKYAARVQRNNLGDHVNECDLRTKLVADDRADVMAFTYPCTKYSSIADISGTRTGDDLYLHAFRHMAIASPDIFIVENVMGMKKFPLVMEAMTKLPDYFIKSFCPLQASDLLPQSRKRIILIGSKKPFNWQSPTTSKKVTLADIVESDPRVTYPTAVTKRMTGNYRDRPIISDPSRGDIAPTAVAHYAKDRSTRLLTDKRFPNGVRPYSVREYARLQGLPDSFSFDSVSDNEAYKIIGNGVPWTWGKWLGAEIKRYFRSQCNQSNKLTYLQHRLANAR